MVVSIRDSGWRLMATHFLPMALISRKSPPPRVLRMFSFHCCIWLSLPATIPISAPEPMSYSFDFSIKHVYPDQETGISIPVFLTYGNRTEKVSAKLDTGADFCVFTRDVAVQLDIPLEAGLKMMFDTSAGYFDAYGHEVSIKSFGQEHTAFVFFAGTPGHRRNLLGRSGWIRHFGIGLFDYESSLYLRPVN
jgi:hypothetical protein